MYFGRGLNRSCLSKRDSVPSLFMINASLNSNVGGYLANMTDEDAPIVTFKTAKHIFGMIQYLAEERCNHGNITIHISADNSPFLPVR